MLTIIGETRKNKENKKTLADWSKLENIWLETLIKEV